MRITSLKVRRLWANITRADTTKRQKLLWDENEIIEFWMEGFNDDGLDKAFVHIVKIYDQVLHKDPQWHYFYEDHYSLIRCSMKYRDKVKKYLDDNNITYKWPVSNWTESMYITNEYQHIYKNIFHSFSTLVIEMFKNEDENKLYEAADRICHPFFNHAMYLADISGKLDIYKDDDSCNTMMWEADQMSQLTTYRASYIGQIKGYKLAVKHMREKSEKQA